LAVKDTNYLEVWGTHIRWAALCPTAWEIVFSGRIPRHYTTPPIVGEAREVHDKVVKIVNEYMEPSRNSSVLYVSKEVAEYAISFDEGRKHIIINAKPDLYVLWDAGGKLINLVVEVTARSLAYIPREWLVAEMLGFYIRNLRPTFALLVQLGQNTKIRVWILPLTTSLFRELMKLMLSGPTSLERARLRESLCYNCDLRNVCPSPLV